MKKDFRREFIRHYSDHMKTLTKNINPPISYSIMRWGFLASEGFITLCYCILTYQDFELYKIVFLTLAFVAVIVFVPVDKVAVKRINNEIQNTRMKAIQLTVGECFVIEGIDQLLGKR